MIQICLEHGSIFLFGNIIFYTGEILNQLMDEQSKDHQSSLQNPFSFRLENSHHIEEQSSNRLFNNVGCFSKQHNKNKNSALSRTFSNSSQLASLQTAINKRMKQKENRKKASNFSTQIYKKNTTITNFRQRNIQREFISRLTRNSVHRKPIEFEQYTVKNHDPQSGINGIQVGENLSHILEILKIITSIFFVFTASFMVPFYSTFKNCPFYIAYSHFGIIYTLFEIVMGFTFINKEEQNRRTLIEISKSYLHGNFIIDFLCLLVFLICAATPHSNFSILYLIFMIKIPDCVRRINKVEITIVETFAMQNYVKLLKLIGWNFTFAHFIAIVMLLMSNFDEPENWVEKCHFVDKQWFEQYCWAYYWAMTTMLSVGFGDITVANYKQALVLTIIEAFGCITIGYNVSSVISLINSLEQKKLQKNRNMNLLKKIKDKDQIQTGVFKEITNFIQQSDQMDAKFNREPLSNLLAKLPDNLQNRFLRSVNEKSIKNLPFFRHLHSTSLGVIAEKIYTKVAHPEQILISNEETYNKILILKQGEVGIFPWFSGLSSMQSSKFQYFDKFVVKEGGASKILNLNFLRPFYKTQNYQYRPIKYCLLLQTNLQQLREVLKSETPDFQMYFQYRDKDFGTLEEYEVLHCEICKGEQQNRNKQRNEQQKKAEEKVQEKHLKINCPRLHYSPIHQQVINKYLKVLKTNKVKRKKFSSLKIVSKEKISGIKEYKNLMSQYTEFGNNQSVYFEPQKDGVKLDNTQNLQPAETSIVPNKIISYYIENRTTLAEPSFGGSILKESTIRKKVVQTIPNFWNVECDKICDFKYYFTGSNAKKLCKEASTDYILNRRYSFLTTFL